MKYLIHMINKKDGRIFDNTTYTIEADNVIKARKIAIKDSEELYKDITGDIIVNVEEIMLEDNDKRELLNE